MRKALLAVAVVGMLATMGTALAADKGNQPSDKAPGTQPQLNPAVLVQNPLKPVLSTAGAEPYFGVMNTGNASSAATTLNITCVPAVQNGPTCKMNNSNDPMAQPNVASVSVPALAKNETKWFGLAACAPPAPNKSCTPIAGSTAAKNWEKATYKFTLVVAGKNASGNWTRP